MYAANAASQYPWLRGYIRRTARGKTIAWPHVLRQGEQESIIGDRSRDRESPHKQRVKFHQRQTCFAHVKSIGVDNRHLKQASGATPAIKQTCLERHPSAGKCLFDMAQPSRRQGYSRALIADGIRVRESQCRIFNA